MVEKFGLFVLPSGVLALPEAEYESKLLPNPMNKINGT